MIRPWIVILWAASALTRIVSLLVFSPVYARGLEDQLLASVVGAEQPELEKTKNDLVQVLVAK